MQPKVGPKKIGRTAPRPPVAPKPRLSQVPIPTSDVQVPTDQEVKDMIDEIASDKVCGICNAEAWKPSDNQERRKVTSTLPKGCNLSDCPIISIKMSLSLRSIHIMKN